jgi:hypothetical protein
MSAAHVALAERWHAAWSGRDPRAFLELGAPDLHYEDPLTREPLFGTAALGQHAQRLWSAFPDVAMEPTGEPLASGAWLALPVRLRGRNTGSLDGLPASHREIAPTTTPTRQPSSWACCRAPEVGGAAPCWRSRGTAYGAAAE